MSRPSAPETVVPRTTPLLAELVAEIREVVQRGLPPEPTAHLAAERLAPSLGRPDLLTTEQCAGDADRYRQHLLHAEPDGSFSLVALVWLPGQRTEIHDHVSWCVTGVHQGQEHERRYRLMTDGRTARLVRAEDVRNPPGALAAFAPPGDIHQVSNSGTTKAISLHIYGADISRLGSSVRRIYLPPEGDGDVGGDV
ncbi:cysteine dioxygenase family protein [Streptomyces sp. NA04227]|uniref:cysteine dioxygenase family protein n=1 Tax=Streptomyces sp. NA04227 TaxID=2742136 RepID=UPI001590C490|nr:cysteine dioxygenase family protein [Streptomyces sp. NA04227]QKW07129.1 cysteine dioxygenase family protein [Streptomyces sp. NA04227]